ncbi:MAG: DNRLRE domain-containing protein [Ignavibacteria bacterium]|nr:DNRLRE domain-containing protein [Ignavibacteria bacterium]MBI3766478.1 DNRLRE domain-containing protein [Ignavibacteriales bacterium]
MKSAILFCGILILLVLSLILGCSDDPNDSGLTLISPQDTVRIESYTSTATSDTTVLFRIPGTSSTLVGKYQDLEVRALMQFTGFSSVPSTARIDSAVVTFTMDYRFKDSSGTIAFNVHEMTRTWSQGSFLWDSSNVPGIYRIPPETTYLKNVIPGDSLVTLRIDKLVNQWVQAGTDVPKGIILIPDAVSSTIVLGTKNISNVDTRPLLTVAYHDSSDSARTFTTRSIQRSFVANGNMSISPDVFYVQAGVSSRGILRFDSLAIPKQVSITEAILELPVDNSSTLLNPSSRDTVLAYLLRKNSPPFDSLALGTVCSPDPLSIPRVYRADIRSIVQLWLTREPNYGILLRPLGEFLTLDRFAYYSSSAPDPALRPKLRIKYTVLP